jgi:hypothetical protein
VHLGYKKIKHTLKSTQSVNFQCEDSAGKHKKFVIAMKGCAGDEEKEEWQNYRSLIDS